MATAAIQPLQPTQVAVLVHDDRRQIGLLENLLAREGLHVRSFDNAASALENLDRQRPPALIVTSLYMPGIDGWRFCRLLRSPDYAGFNQVPILVVSSTFAGEEAARVASDLGANAFLTSAADEGELAKQVRLLLRGERPPQSAPVLIVEDDAELAEVLRQTFLAHGYQADTAQSGGEAQSRLEAKAYDVVVIDHHLPDISGVHLLATLHRRCPEAVYLAITGDPRPERALEWIKCGAAAFVRKPFEPPYLVELCAKARRERDLLWVEHRLELRTRELRQSEERFAAFMSNLPAAAFIKDAEGRTLFANHFLQALFGFRDWTGKTTRELIPGELGQKMAEDDRKVLARGPMKTEEGLADSQGVTRTFETIKFPIPVDGESALLGGISVDITDRKRAEAALRDSEEKFRSVVESSPMAMHLYRLEEDGRLLLTGANPAADRILGIRHQPLLGLPILEAFSALAATSVPEVYSRIARGQVGPQSFEIPYGGRRCPGVYEVHAFRTGPNTMATAFLDISHRKRLEEQLLQAQKMESIGRLAGGVAHDFNNMLQAILGNVGLALEDLPSGSPLREHLEEIEHCAQRSADLTRQLLAFARKQTIAPKVLDLNATVETALKMLRRLIGEDIDLAWVPAAHLWPVKIDPSQVDQILANLCVNARDAIHGIGKVTLETGNFSFDEAYAGEHAGFVPGDYVLLAVTDTGRGMDKEMLGHLFEPFFTTKGPGQGTGLGLATVYGVVRQNQGFINVYSEPAHGTTFKIYLPRHIHKAESAPQESRLPSSARGQETILLVEDELAILRVAQRTLTGLGYVVLAASTPGEALAVAERHAGPIHLLMTDVVMPEMNGRELARRLLSFYPELKRLFMSGYTANVIAHHGVLDEGIHFLQKPFSTQTLADKVREAIDSP